MTFVLLHRARFAIGAEVLLELESSSGQGAESPAIDIPRLLSAELEVGGDSVGSFGAPPMCWREGLALFERFQLREDTEYFLDITVPLSLEEAKRRASLSPTWPLKPSLSSVFRRDPTRRWREAESNGDRYTTVTGHLSLRSHAGILDLSTEVGGEFRAEVVCRKLGYFEEFKALLDSLAEKAAELLLAYEAPVSLTFEVSPDEAMSDAALYFLMRYVMAPGQLPAAVAQILSSPHSILRERTATVSIEEVEDIDADALIGEIEVSALARGGPLARLFCGHTPRELAQRYAYESSDTPENRFCKAFLIHCRSLAERLESRMRVSKRAAAAREAQLWALELDEWLQHGLWQEVGALSHSTSNSQVLLKRRGYKELYRFDLALRASLSLSWPEGNAISDGLLGDSRPVSQIYEYWCFFVLRDVLRSVCQEVGGGDLLRFSKDRLHIRLAKGRQSECKFEFTTAAGAKLEVSLFYNRRFSRHLAPQKSWTGSYTASFNPDYSVLISGPDKTLHWLHFDAKYRSDSALLDAIEEAAEVNDTSEDDLSSDPSTEYTKELLRVHKLDDLFKMHTYRDGILSTRGAYVLFPGDGAGGETLGPRQNHFVRHPSALGGHRAQVVPSVGAFPLTPSHSDSQTGAIRELIRSTLEAAGGGSSYVEERAWFGPTP